MSQELKFRATVSGVVIELTFEELLTASDDYSTEEVDEIVRTVRMYTGLVDKNGREIYEGDLVDIADTKCQVRFDEGMFTVWAPNLPEGVPAADVYRTYPYEVVGSVYDTGQTNQTGYNT